MMLYKVSDDDWLALARNGSSFGHRRSEGTTWGRRAYETWQTCIQVHLFIDTGHVMMTTTSYYAHFFLVVKSRMEMRVLYHLGSVQQDVRRRILPTSIEGHDLAHGDDRDLVVCHSQIARLNIETT
jgi:hypothetical protein